MAKLIWVGENCNNVRGKSCKAYCIRRTGSTVLISYGSVEVKGGGGGKYFWCGRYPKKFPKPFRTIAKATAFIKRQISAKVAKGYDRMPGRVKIEAKKKHA